MVRILFALFLVVNVLFFSGCGSPSPTSENVEVKDLKQPDFPITNHSFSQPEAVKVSHLDLKLALDFDRKVVKGSATWTLDHKQEANYVFLDVWGMQVLSVRNDQSDEPLPIILGPAHELFGQGLAIPIDGKTKTVTVEYETDPSCKALQWLPAEQTADKTMPFLYSQSQAILARTWVPCQDVPGVRFTYSAEVKAPEGMLAVMSASNPTQKAASGEYQFQMKQPIPSYLMALSAGDLVFASIGKKTGVFAEPSVIESAVYEFGDMENMLHAAEALYGDYVWDRYDVLVLPPSFPFGGMENPRLTFATPTILAGDRSLTSLVAHELAHSWSGNLVTNITWDDFWLNEGFTVYFERRIMEALYGKDFADMLAQLGFQDLEHTVAKLDAEDTHLKLDLEGRDPDEGLTDIAYEKGYFFLRMLEETVGREKFDAFLKSYFNSHAFQSMDTEGFLSYLESNLLTEEGMKEGVDLKAWVYGPGIPNNCPAIASERFASVEKAIEFWKEGAYPGKLSTKNWKSSEWQHFLRNLPMDMSQKQLSELDQNFGFTQSGNSEILSLWFVRAIHGRYAPAKPALEDFLSRVGRRKFLEPIYTAMKESDQLDWALELYGKYRSNYHAVSTGTLDELLGYSTLKA
ncbi:MAG: M1 family metallopeptidase [Salibacteraceae bacterium]